MALIAHLSLEGETQGDITGSSTVTGREGTIEVIAYSHAIRASLNPATGWPTGERTHTPLTVTKEVDRSSPLLAAALANAENLPTWRLDLYRPSAAGTEERYYQIELVNASVCEILFEQLNNKYVETFNHDAREHVSFAYQRIILTSLLPSVRTGDDDWSAPTA